MTDPIEIMARAIVGQQADDILLAANPLGEPAEYPAWMLHQPDARRVISSLADAGYAVVPASGTVDMVAAFWRQKNAGTQEVGKTGPDTHDMAAMHAAIEAGRVKG